MKYPPRGSELCGPGEIPRPIFGLDIDGTLGFYHEHFWSFACAWTGRRLPHPDEFTGGSFAAHLGLAKTTYRKIKLAYRRGGAKRSMPVIPGASILTESLRSRGAVVVLCTTRPYLSLEGVDEDTRHWARRNQIRHDFIIWGENKYKDLARFGGRVVSVLEDDPALLKQAMDAGLVANSVFRSYNSNLPHDTMFLNGFWHEDLNGVYRTMHHQLDEWEARQ